MKVLLFDVFQGGHHLEYVEHISSYMIDQGDAVTFATWGGGPQIEDLRTRLPTLNVLTLAHKNSPTFGWGVARNSLEMSWALRRAFAFARSSGMHVFHNLYMHSSELPLYLASAAGRKPYGVFGTFFGTNTPGLTIFRRSVRKSQRLALRRLLTSQKLDGLFVSSPRVREAFISELGSSVPGNRLIVVPDPAPPLRGVSRTAARDWLALPPGVPVLLFFGGLRTSKGVDHFLEALTMLQTQHDWRALVVGSPEQFGAREIESCRAQLSNPDRLLARLDFVPGDDMDRYFAAADVVVLPYRSTYRGTSGVLQHAAAAGKPVIATDTGDVGPTVREWKLGLVVEPDSTAAIAGAIGEFLDRREEITEQATPRARAFAARSSWEAWGQRVRREYAKWA